MEPILIATIVSALLTITGLAIGYIQWRRDVKIKLGQLRETVSVELIRQRVEPYSQFYKQLESVSSVHKSEILSNPKKKIKEFIDILQENIYGKVGLLASHQTRLLLLYLRSGCQDIIEGKIQFSDIRLRLWALHNSLRSDLGISQPMWSSEVERVHIAAIDHEEQTVVKLVESYPWDRVYSSEK